MLRPPVYTEVCIQNYFYIGKINDVCKHNEFYLLEFVWRHGARNILH